MSNCEIIAELRRQHERHRGSGTRMEQVLKNAADALTRLRLTDEDREAIYRAEARLRTAYVPDDETAATLRNLLERLHD
jgi:hypothetical protein